MSYDLIILGAGPIGLYASFLAGYMKFNVLCIEIDSNIGGQPTKFYPTKPIYDFPGFKAITGYELIQKLKEQVDNYETVQIKTSIEIVEYIEENEWLILKDTNGNQYKTKYLLITIGNGVNSPRKIDENLIQKHAHIHYTLKEQDYYENKNIVILGGGDGAIDHSIHIKNNFNPNNVYLIHYKNELKSNNKTIDDLRKHDINVFLNHNIVKIHEDKIILNNEKNTIEIKNIDRILVQYGLDAKKTFVHLWDDIQKINNKILVNGSYQTSCKRIFAAGSCIYNPDRINMIITGISEATIAINKIKTFFPNKKVIW